MPKHDWNRRTREALENQVKYPDIFKVTRKGKETEMSNMLGLGTAYGIRERLLKMKKGDKIEFKNAEKEIYMTIEMTEDHPKF